MKIAVHLARNRRLLAWCVLSLLLHLLLFAWVAARLAPAPPAVGAPLALRLAPVPVLAPAASAPAPAAAPLPAPSPAAAAPASTPAIAADAAHAASAAPAPAPPSPEPPPAALTATSGSAPLRMPGRYRVRLPPAARLDFAVTRSAPGAAPAAAGSAELDWQAEPGRYRLRLDGVLGRLESEGGEDDAGIAPGQASEEGRALTRFDREAGRVERAGAAASDTLYPGSQDRASVLMQLAAIGLADPDQMQDVLEIVVAGAGGGAIARFQVLGREDLATAIGTLATVRLLQLARAGEPRLDIWLAPAHAWLPVQLRVTQPDGTVVNQQVTAIEVAAAPD